MIEDTKHYDYFKTFFFSLSPAFQGNQFDADQMRNLLKDFEKRPEKSFFCRCLKEEIYLIERIIKLR